MSALRKLTITDENGEDFLDFCLLRHLNEVGLFCLNPEKHLCIRENEVLEIIEFLNYCLLHIKDTE